jgi:anti-sigma factor RsiW
MMRRLRMRVVGLRCRHVMEIITDYLDGALDESTTRAIDVHLSRCHGCHAAMEQFRTTISLSGRLSSDDLAQLPPMVRDELMAAFRDRGHR